LEDIKYEGVTKIKGRQQFFAEIRSPEKGKK